MADENQEFVNEGITISLIRKILDLPEERQLSLLKQLEDASLNDDAADERDDTRKSFQQPIRFTMDNEEYTGVSEDISSGGMFIRTDEGFSVGQLIIIDIPMSNKRNRVKVPAEIARVLPHGIGVEFLKKVAE